MQIYPLLCADQLIKVEETLSSQDTFLIYQNRRRCVKVAVSIPYFCYSDYNPNLINVCVLVPHIWFSSPPDSRNILFRVFVLKTKPF